MFIDYNLKRKLTLRILKYQGFEAGLGDPRDQCQSLLEEAMLSLGAILWKKSLVKAHKHQCSSNKARHSQVTALVGMLRSYVHMVISSIITW